MADDYHRVFIRIDGEEKPIMMSRTDLKTGMQSMWLDDMNEGWKLLEGRMPELMMKAMDARDAKKEAERKKIMEELGVNKSSPLKMLILRNAAWVAVLVATVIILRPDLAKHLFPFLF